MMNLPVYNNRTPLDLSKEDLKRVHKNIYSLVDSITFFYQRLQNKPTMTDVHTHMGLFESYFTEIAKIVNYESVLTEEEERRNKELHKANTEIRRLQTLLGKDISPEAVSAALRKYDNIFRCFYGALGFRYASLEKYTSFGIIYEFSPELEYHADDGTSGEKEMSKDFQKRFRILACEDTVYDIYRDTYHAELLDTDKNKKLITELVSAEFPNATIPEFRSRRNDFGSFSMGFAVYVPYGDIEELYRRVTHQKREEERVDGDS